MARWLVMRFTSSAGIPTHDNESWIVLLSTLIAFYVCVSVLLAVCAVRRNPQVVDDIDQSSSVREPAGSLATESRKMSQRFSGSTAAISKLSASFRISSFRDPPSFRISSFRSSDCRSQVDVIDALRRSQAVVEEIDTEPAVWQRAILRGERCAPLSFSGLILYDEHGNPLPTPEPASEDLTNSDQQTVASPRYSQEELAAFSD